MLHSGGHSFSNALSLSDFLVLNERSLTAVCEDLRAPDFSEHLDPGPGKSSTAQVAIFAAILTTEGECLVAYDLFTSALLTVISHLSLACNCLGLRSVI